MMDQYQPVKDVILFINNNGQKLLYELQFIKFVAKDFDYLYFTYRREMLYETWEYSFFPYEYWNRQRKFYINIIIKLHFFSRIDSDINPKFEEYVEYYWYTTFFNEIDDAICIYKKNGEMYEETAEFFLLSKIQEPYLEQEKKRFIVAFEWKDFGPYNVYRNKKHKNAELILKYEKKTIIDIEKYINNFLKTIPENTKYTDGYAYYCQIGYNKNLIAEYKGAMRKQNKLEKTFFDDLDRLLIREHNYKIQDRESKSFLKNKVYHFRKENRIKEAIKISKKINQEKYKLKKQNKLRKQQHAKAFEKAGEDAKSLLKPLKKDIIEEPRVVFFDEGIIEMRADIEHEAKKITKKQEKREGIFQGIPEKFISKKIHDKLINEIFPGKGKRLRRYPRLVLSTRYRKKRKPEKNPQNTKKKDYAATLAGSWGEKVKRLRFPERKEKKFLEKRRKLKKVVRRAYRGAEIPVTDIETATDTEDDEFFVNLIVKKKEAKKKKREDVEEEARTLQRLKAENKITEEKSTPIVLQEYKFKNTGYKTRKLIREKKRRENMKQNNDNKDDI
jgi:hypothetical protein